MVSKKIKSITPSFTINISAKVAKLKSEGKEIIDLSIGEPDFMTPNAGKITAKEAIDHNKTKYDMVPGLIPLRDSIVKKLELENHVKYSTSEIVVSSGAKNAITNALTAILDPYDEVVIPAPYWTSYPEMVKLCYGVPIIVQTDKSNDFKLTVKQLSEAITDRTKIVLINNPSNPTGAVYSKEELEPLIEFCINHNLIILADEIYERICYDHPFVSIPSISERAKEITILVNGFSKSAAMTGWRLGYTASNIEISKAISTLQGHLISHPSTIAQWAGYGALKEGSEDMKHMVSIYKNRRDTILPILNQLENVGYVNPQGAFYLFLDLSAYKKFYNNHDSFSIAFCNQLLDEHQVAVVPGIAFGNDDYIRISYATKIELVIEGLHRIQELLSFIKK
ncbi:pyridoxal phosphate-dependent aminotransferase [Fusibacter bizertensis]|uniref:Aminotransferase n=1 Tax=Fusibacter bizertensis TaxID=1488331 RepID=A0ABT6NDG6_9FIRM|nr:pyridoxal phosphate-dependent aminotransferase [Fusibacter bizertensis]MDH8678459.1 pyridoxal phosphate-dependent aminotransferase [Fusibacter bizertensis]